MSRFEVKKPSLCTAGPAWNESVSESLGVLHGIIKSCYGPSGRLKQIHNGTGGCVLTTSQSSALFKGFSVQHPVLKLLIASICNHISSFSDCGLFAANLCCNMIENFGKLHMSPHTVIKLSKSLLSICINYLKADECECKVAVDFSSSKSLLCLAHSVLSSKPACMLTIKESSYISTLVVKAFLSTIPDEGGASVMLGKSILVPIEGENVMASLVVPGLLVEMPEFILHRALPSSGFPTKPIKLALFSISLAGDFCDTGEGTVDILDSVDPEIVMLDKLFILGKQLVDDHVTFLLCQKVIHPALKQYLKGQNVLAVDRLGATLMEPLVQMTGARPIASFGSVPPSCYGTLRHLSKVSHGSKQFLHLTPFDTTVCSLVLCNRNETSLKELMRTCQTSEHVLQLALKYPWVLLGGGCTETHLAAFIRSKSTNINSSCLEELNCSIAEYKLVANSFCLSLESVARSLEHNDGEILIDLEEGHLWSVAPNTSLDSHWSEIGHRCGCGMHKTRANLQWSVLGSPYPTFNPQVRKDKISVTHSDQLILDSFTAKCNALQVAVDTAGLVLDLSYIVEDKN